MIYHLFYEGLITYFNWEEIISYFEGEEGAIYTKKVSKHFCHVFCFS